MSFAVIFDMDGVLIDSQPLHYEIDMRVLKACGYPARLETVTPYTGIGNPDRWPAYKRALGLSQSTDELINMAEKTMRDVFSHADFNAVLGVPSLLTGLKAMGIKCAVASSSSHELIQLVLNRIGIGIFFDELISGEDVKAGKPAPDIYLRAADKLGLPVSRCVAVEDAPSGILAAKNAGLTCIAYKNPSTAGQDFTHADFVVDKFEQCLPVIRKLI